MRRRFVDAAKGRAESAPAHEMVALIAKLYRIERAIRPFVVGRKGWLFSGSPRGAHASALLFSLVETAKANGLEPWAYLNYLFENYPRAKTNEDIFALLPHNLKEKNLKLALPSIP